MEMTTIPGNVFRVRRRGWPVDAIDHAILRILGNPFDGVVRKPADLRAPALAARIGTSAPTVRAHLARMREAGFLEGFVLIPNPALRGQDIGVSFHRIPTEGKSRAIARLGEVPGLVSFIDFVGPPLIVFGHASDEAAWSTMMAAHSEALGALPEWHTFATTLLRRDPPAMSDLDRRIVAALAGDALRGPEDVAKEVGVTRRTVQTRLDRLLDEQCVYLAPYIDRSRVPGAVLYMVMLRVEPERRAAIVEGTRRLLGDRLLAVGNPSADDHHLMVNAWAHHAGAAEESRLLLEALPGVMSAENLVPVSIAEDLEAVQHSTR